FEVVKRFLDGLFPLLELWASFFLRSFSLREDKRQDHRSRNSQTSLHGNLLGTSATIIVADPGCKANAVCRKQPVRELQVLCWAKLGRSWAKNDPREIILRKPQNWRKIVLSSRFTDRSTESNIVAQTCRPHHRRQRRDRPRVDHATGGEWGPRRHHAGP